MQRTLSAAIIMIGLAISVAMKPTAASQDDRHQGKVYDRDHKDYHDWDDREKKEWSIYLSDNHRKEHDYSKASRKEQSAYWNWRHDHPDNDSDRSGRH